MGAWLDIDGWMINEWMNGCMAGYRWIDVYLGRSVTVTTLYEG
jgi:hypothetical protein